MVKLSDSVTLPYGTFPVARRAGIAMWLVHPLDLQKPQVIVVAPKQQLLLAFPPHVLGHAASVLRLVANAGRFQIRRNEEPIANVWQIGHANRGAMPGIVLLGYETKDVYDQQAKLVKASMEVKIGIADVPPLTDNEREWGFYKDPSELPRAHLREIPKEDREQIRQEVKAGASWESTARKFGVSISSVAALTKYSPLRRKKK